LFKQYGVQLVIGGHNHYYARAVTDSVQHFTLGGGGAPLYAPASGQPNIVKTDQSFHHTELDINGNTMLYTARRSDGTVIESFTLPAGANQPPIANAGTDQSISESATVRPWSTGGKNRGRRSRGESSMLRLMNGSTTWAPTISSTRWYSGMDCWQRSAAAGTANSDWVDQRNE
jgi:hypothetical protein